MNALSIARSRPAGAARRGLAWLTAGWLAAVGSLAQSTSAATLAELLNGGFLLANDCRFDNWQLAAFDATAGTPNLSLVNVAPLVNDALNPGLQFTANDQLATTGINAVDLTLTFDVHALDGAKSFIAANLAMTGVNFGGSGGVAYISQELATVGGTQLGAALVIADNESDVFQIANDAAISPHKTLSVTLNTFLSGLAPADTINLSTFTARFWQNGPAALGGDFNLDNVVDGADFLSWQRGQSPAPLSSQDLASWKANYGGAIAVAASAMPAPEPAAAPLLGGALAAAQICRRTTRKRRSSASRGQLRHPAF